MPRRLLLASAALALVAANGCATARKDAAESNPELYEYVYETGSLVPKRVRKDRQMMDRGQNVEILEVNRLEQMQRDQMIRNMPRDRPGS